MSRGHRGGAPALRRARAGDVAALFRVRTAVRENHQSVEELAALGISEAAVAEMLESGEAAGWCAVEGGEVVGFAMARTAERDVFALFLLPEHEGRGLGGALLDVAVAWLREAGDGPVRLATGRGTRAHGFYLARGWRQVGVDDDGDPLLELRA